MAFSANAGGMNAKCDMNVVPLIDVLLVLLIIFMVTVPAVSYQIQVDLPQPTRQQQQPPVNPPPPVRLRIDGGGQLFWDNTPIPFQALTPQMQLEAAREVQPVIEIETSPDAQYQVLARVLAMAKNAGLEKIGFVDAR